MANLSVLGGARFKSRLSLVLACILSGSGWSCVLASSQIDGRVINHATGEPIADAFVIATWTHYGSDGVGSRTTCRGLEILKTDAAGRYVVPARSGDVDIDVYKPGLAEYFAKPGLATREEIEASRRLREMVGFSGSPRDRVKQFEKYGWYAECRSENVVATLSPLYRALDEEASQLGVPTGYSKFLNYLDESIKQRAAREGSKNR